MCAWWGVYDVGGDSGNVFKVCVAVCGPCAPEKVCMAGLSLPAYLKPVTRKSGGKRETWQPPLQAAEGGGRTQDPEQPEGWTQLGASGNVSLKPPFLLLRGPHTFPSLSWVPRETKVPFLSTPVVSRKGKNPVAVLAPRNRRPFSRWARSRRGSAFR